MDGHLANRERTQPLNFNPELARPEVLADERLFNLVAAIGNHEGKALLMLALGQTGEYEFFGPRGLHKLLTELPGSNDAYIGNKSIQLNWCQATLEPIGMVTKADFGDYLRYGISEVGREYGVPLAALLLDFAETHNVSLQAIFGASQTRSSLRSPAVRIGIMEEIFSNPGSPTLRDLVRATSVASQVIVGRHLRALGNAKFIHYEDWDEGKSKNIYSLTDKIYVPSARSGDLRPLVAEYMAACRTIEFDDLANYCAQRTAGENDDQAPSNLRRNLVVILNQLMKRGFLNREEGRSANSPIKVSLSETQTALWLDLLNSLERFKSQEPDYIQQLRQRAGKILNDPGLIAKALNRAAENSPHALNGSEKSMANLVMTVLNSKPETLSVRDIVSDIVELTGRSISHYGVVAILGHLRDDEKISVLDGLPLRYQLASTSKD